jgi:integrase
MLTDTICKSASCPEGKSFKRYSDSGGMYLEVTASGGKYWRLKYRVGSGDEKSEKRLSLGVYPAVSLKIAREKRDEAKKLINEGQDPSHVKKMQKRDRQRAIGQSFKEVALEWHKVKKSSWSEGHSLRTLRQLERDLFPWIGDRPMKDITGSEILFALRKVEERGAIETADRGLMLCRQIWEYVALDGIADVTRGIKSKLKPYRGKNFRAIIEPKRFAELLRAIDGYKGTAVVRAALKLSPILFQRPLNLRTMQWSQLDLDEGIWIIPSMEMKREKYEKENGDDHVVPLPTQAIEILKEVKRYTGNGKYVFRGERSADNPMSDGTINRAIRSLGFGSEQVAHGFRASGRTILDEVLNKDSRHLEAQLAHAVPDANGTSYNRTQFIKQRMQIMQDWADYLDSIKAGAVVINLKSA